MRIGQGVGGALVMGNSSAILTDAFPSQERGLALGVNAVAAIAGSFMGLVLGGLLAPVSWRLVFLVSVPFGVFGTVWAYWKLQERGERRPARIDWWGNATFAIGLILVLVSITYGIQPYGGHSMGWTNPLVLARDGHPGSCCSRSSSSSSCTSTIRCSASGCSASGPSPPAASPRCSHRSAAAG